VFIDSDLAAAPSAVELLGRVAAVAPAGLTFVEATRLAPQEPPLGRLITAADWLVAVPAGGLTASELDRAMERRVEQLLAAASLWVRRERPQPGSRGVAPPPIRRTVDLRPWLVRLEPLPTHASNAAAEGLGWDPACAVVRVRTKSSAEGGVKPAELCRLFAALDDADYISTWERAGFDAPAGAASEALVVDAPAGAASEALVGARRQPLCAREALVLERPAGASGSPKAPSPRRGDVHLVVSAPL
jgi:hypothetical protein